MTRDEKRNVLKGERNMISQHFMERYQERVLNLGMGKNFETKLTRHILELCQKSNQDESVCVYEFDSSDLQDWDDENELSVIIKNNTLVTCIRRNKNDRRRTNPRHMNVDSVYYNQISY